jgi:hypothetical protein
MSKSETQVAAARHTQLDRRQSCFRNTIAVDSTIPAWKAWRNSAPLDIVNDVSSLSYFRRYVDRIRAAVDQETGQEQWRLAQITGFRVWFQDSVSAQARADSTWSYIVKYRKPIVVENLIHSLWVASNAETVKALAVLRNETGQNFATAKEWSTWWDAQESK